MLIYQGLKDLKVILFLKSNYELYKLKYKLLYISALLIIMFCTLH